MSSSGSAIEVCDGENLAIILGLYWVVYMIINAIIFAAAMYALQQCVEGAKRPGHKSHDKGDAVSRTNSRMSLVSRS
jgi:hypothetical protein